MSTTYIENLVALGQMSKTEIENLIAEQTKYLDELEKRIVTQKANGNISYAVILDERADLVLKEIFNLRRRLQRLQ